MTALFLLLSYTAAVAQTTTVKVGQAEPVTLSEETAVQLGELPAGTVFSYVITAEGTKTVTFEIVDVTSNTVLKSVTSKQNSAGFAAGDVATFELPIKYDLASGHSYEACFKEFASMSTLGKTPVAAFNYKMSGSANVAVYSDITVVSITPSQSFDAELDTPIIITFSAPVASLSVKAVIGQMSSVDVAAEDITTSDNQTWQVNLCEGYFSQGALSLNFIAVDAEGNRVTDANNGVGLPESCYIQYGWASTVGLPTPKLVQDGKEITSPLSTFNFMYEGIGLNADNLSARWSDITILRDGQDLGIQLTESMFKVLGNESVGGTQLNLTLPEALQYNGEYTLVLPARAFILGHDNVNMFNGAATYKFTISGLEDAPGPTITFNITKTNWTRVGSDNGETIGSATLANSTLFDHFEFEITCEEDPDQYITIAASLSNPGTITCYDPRKLYKGYHYTLRAKAFDVPYYGVAPIAVAEYQFEGQGEAAPVFADIEIAAIDLTESILGGYVTNKRSFDVTFTAPVSKAEAWNAAGMLGSNPVDIVQKDAEGLVWTITLPESNATSGEVDSYNINIVVWDANGVKAKGWNADNSFVYSVLYEGVTGINGINAASAQTAKYNLAGQRINNRTKGIVIVDGKKTLLR